MRYPKIKENEDGWSKWIQPKMSGYGLGCCDCGLVHKLEFRITKSGKVQFRARRDEKDTLMLRKRDFTLTKTEKK